MGYKIERVTLGIGIFPNNYNNLPVCFRGAPERYDSHGVMRMVSERGRPRRSQLFEAPTEEIETEGDRQLKRLVEKQLDKTADKR